MLIPAMRCVTVIVVLVEPVPRRLYDSVTEIGSAAARSRKDRMVPHPPAKMKGLRLPSGLWLVSLSAATIGGTIIPATGPDTTNSGI
jgi:hypothetical protein